MALALAALFAAGSLLGAGAELKASQAEARDAEEQMRAALFDKARIGIDLPRKLAERGGAAAAMSAAIGALGTNNAYEAQTQANFETVLDANREMSDLDAQAARLRTRAKNVRQAGQLRALSTLVSGGAKAYSAWNS